MKRFCIGVLLVLGFSKFVLAEESFEISSFSPAGTVQKVKQVRVTFSEAMVPLGDLNHPKEPFEIQCPQHWKARWIDSKNRVYDFDQELPPGVQCEFNWIPSVQSLAGKSLKGDRKFKFATGQPTVTSIRPYSGDRIAEDQYFALVLNGEVQNPTVLQKASWTVEGIQERIEAKVVEGAERAQIVKSLRFHKDEEPFIVVVKAKRNFPPNKKVAFVWSGTEEQRFDYQVRDEFQARLKCERTPNSADCNPFGSIHLSFSEGIPATDARAIVLKSKTGKVFRPVKLEPEDLYRDDTEIVSFNGPFPEKTPFQVIIPSQLRDISGRKLKNASSFPMDLETSEYPPLAKFSAEFGILEAADPVLPVTVRKIDVTNTIQGKILTLPFPIQVPTILKWLRSVGMQGQLEKRAVSILKDPGFFGPKPTAFEVPKPNGADAFEVVGIPLKTPGLHIVEIESKLLGKNLLGADQPMFVSTAAWVTQLSVHLKKGRDSSLVWVTSLETGKPVADARVSVVDCHGNVLDGGKSDANGLFQVKRSLKNPPTCQQEGSYSSYDSGIFITAEKGGDFAFAHTSWNRGIESWRFGLDGYVFPDRPDIFTTIFDRPLFRAGETVHMKHVARLTSGDGFSWIPQKDLPKTVRVVSSMRDQKFELPLKWNSQGVAETEWNIPKDASLGVYTVGFPNKENSDSVYWDSHSGSFRVEEFRVPLVRAKIQPAADVAAGATRFGVNLSAEFLAGGVAKDLPVTFRYTESDETSRTFKNWEGYVFATGPAPQKLEYEEGNASEKPIHKHTLNLDKTGAAHIWVEGLKRKDLVNRIHLEMEYRDPHGEIQTTSSSVVIDPSTVLLGIKNTHWLEGKKLSFNVAAVDGKGRPRVGVPVQVELIKRNYYSHRKKLVGGFYSYENKGDIRKLGSFCQGVTDSKGILKCDGNSPAGGVIVIEAKTSDPVTNQPVLAHSQAYVSGFRDNWFGQQDEDRIDLIPERRNYEAGETARFQLKMPFKQATALITVEREGILSSRVISVTSDNPVIEVPILKNYSPNAYVSAFVIRGRVSDFKPTAFVDLGRPAYKLGISEIEVGWKSHELKVDVKTDRDTYQVREQARVQVHVTNSDGSPASSGEVAVAVVDEGLLQLVSNDSWNILANLMKKRPYSVEAYTAQSEVIGKRHFGLKAVPHGGGGGNLPTRELFDTLLFWKASVKLDKNGNATVQVPLNDSVTGFRVVAVAQNGVDQFGTGDTRFRAIQDLAILAGIPPVVRQGDQILTEVTLRNSTENPMEVSVSGKATGVAQALDSKKIHLDPNQSQEVKWSVQIPKKAEKIEYEIKAESDRKASDRIRVSQKVLPAVPVRTFQGTLTQVDSKASIPIEAPPGMLPGLGGVDLQLQSSLSVGLTGVSDYMRAYPYNCIEQKLSQAVALREQKFWNQEMKGLSAYLDPEGLVRYFPSPNLTGSDTLTAYLLILSAESGWEIPQNLRDRMIQGLKKFIQGGLGRERPVQTVNLEIRKTEALEALARMGQMDESLLSSVRVSTLGPQQWPTAAVISWLGILRHFDKVPDRAKKIQEAEMILKSRVIFQGTQLSFSTEAQDRCSSLMIESDWNSTRLALAVQESQTWPGLTEDLPRLIRGMLARQVYGHWSTTPANAFGVLAVDHFVKKYESGTVVGKTLIQLDTQKLVWDWNRGKSAGKVHLSWPKKASNLEFLHQGAGKPWAVVQTQAALPLKEPIASGFKIHKTWKAIDQKKPGVWSKGDVIRVHLDLEAQAEQTWVVLNDPIPAGATILGSGLGNDSSLATAGEKSSGWNYPTYEERTFDSYRAYYETVSSGNWSVEYTFRLNQAGKMSLPPTRTEAMYAPDVFGETPNAGVEIRD